MCEVSADSGGTLGTPLDFESQETQGGCEGSPWLGGPLGFITKPLDWTGPGWSLTGL